MNRSVTVRSSADSTVNRAGAVSLPTWRRARLASCRHAAGVRPTIPAMSANENRNTSCSTNAVRSAGDRRCNTTWRARRTLSSSVTRSDGIGAGGAGTALAASLARPPPDGRRRRERPRVGVAAQVLALAPGRAELVEAQPADDGHQPGPHVVELVGVGAEEPGERLLHRILRVAEVTEHPQGDVEHVAPVLAPGAAEAGVDFRSVGGLSSWWRLIARSSGGRRRPSGQMSVTSRDGRGRRNVTSRPRCHVRAARPVLQPMTDSTPTIEAHQLSKTYPGGVEAVRGRRLLRLRRRGVRPARAERRRQVDHGRHVRHHRRSHLGHRPYWRATTWPATPWPLDERAPSSSRTPSSTSRSAGVRTSSSTPGCGASTPRAPEPASTPSWPCSASNRSSTDPSAGTAAVSAAVWRSPGR